jgi:hypothetical protein
VRIRLGRSKLHGRQRESHRLTRCSVDAKAIEDRRQWALDQTLALCRNASVPKEDSWISSVLDFLLVHGFFVIRKLDKKSPIGAVSAERSEWSDPTSSLFATDSVPSCTPLPSLPCRRLPPRLAERGSSRVSWN